MSRAVATRAVCFVNRWRQLACGAVLTTSLVATSALAFGSPAGAQRLIAIERSLAPAFVGVDELPRPAIAAQPAGQGSAWKSSSRQTYRPHPAPHADAERFAP